jgi:RNA-directed DNA polymerase
MLRQLNLVLRGWCTYFRHGMSKATFHYLDQYTWHRVAAWIRRRHNKTKWDLLWRRFLPNRRLVEDGVELFQPQTVTVSRYRYRAAANIRSPWPTRSPESIAQPSDMGSWRAGCVETRTSGSEGGMRKRNACKGVNAPHPDPTHRS